MTISTTVREMPRAMFRRWRRRIERRTTSSLWGQRRYVYPRLVPFLFGDGKQWVALEPFNHRPAYYVVRIDARVNLGNWARHRNVVLDVIGDYFGEQYDGGWPTLDWTNGGAWYPYEPPRSTK